LFPNFHSAKVEFIFESELLESLYCSSINNSSAKLAFFLPTKLVNSFSSSCQGSLVAVKNFYMNAIPCSYAMVKNSILYPYFEEVMDKLIPSGIPQYLPDFHAYLLYGNYENSEENFPKILTIDDLSFGFILWLIACGISICGFLGEIVVILVIKILKDAMGLLLLLNSLKKLSFDR
jgi:hypothetical protein